jgi:hypothetical protein
MHVVTAQTPVRRRWSTRLLRDHAAGLSVALLLAMVLVAPRWWLLWSDPSEGVRTQVNPGGTFGVGQDESFYIAGVRSAFEGRLPLTDPYLVDGQNRPPQPSAFWEEFVGVLGHATGGNIFYALAIVTSLAAVLGFGLFYAFAQQITASKRAAVVAMLITVAYVQTLQQAGGYLSLRHWSVLEPIVMLRPNGEFHVWYRFLSPAMTVPLFFATVLAVQRAFDTRSNRWSAGAAILTALSIYTYAFLWTALVVAFSLWGLWLLVSRDYAAVRRLVAIGAGAAVLASPELAVLIYNAVSVPLEVKRRSGLDDLGVDTGAFVAIGQRLIVAAPFAYWARRSVHVRFFVALYCAPLGLAATAGIVPQTDHYFYQVWPLFSLPLFIAGTCGFVVRLSPRHKRFASAALGVLAIGGAVHFVAFQTRAAQRLDSSYALRTDEDAAFRWLRANAPGDATVVTPSRSTNLLLASLTPVFVYVPYGSSAVGSKAGDDEIIDRYLRASAAVGYTPDATMGRLDPANGIPLTFREAVVPRAEIPTYVERSMVDYLLNELVAHPDIVNARIPEWRSKFMALKSQAGVLGEYAATYIYCGPRERLWAVDAPSPGTRVTIAFQQDQVTVYRLGDTPGAVPFRGC